MKPWCGLDGKFCVDCQGTQAASPFTEKEYREFELDFDGVETRVLRGVLFGVSPVLNVERIFCGHSFEDILMRILSALKDNPEYVVEARGTEMREITNLSFELSNPFDNLVWNGVRDADYEFAVRYFGWMLNGGSDYEYMRMANGKHPFDKFVRNDAGDDEVPRFSAAYGPRIQRQLGKVFDELVRDPGTRRAVVQVRHEGDLETLVGTDSSVEFPCTNHLHFMLRDHRLNLTVSMRSNNMATTAVYDVFIFTMYQQYMLRALNAETGEGYGMGSYHQHCGSAHYFTSQDKLVQGMLASRWPHMRRRDNG
jgi:thymidylate synthase